MARKREPFPFGGIRGRIRFAGKLLQVFAYQLIDAGADRFRAASSLANDFFISRKGEVHVHIIRVHVLRVNSSRLLRSPRRRPAATLNDVTALEAYELTTKGGATDFSRLIAACESFGPYCLIGGLAVNCYVEPVYTLDADIVVIAACHPALTAHLLQWASAPKYIRTL